ncbi:MAG: oxidoreductase [Xanthobacteraceae bacterium]|nr:oxidoreductase [Xanthobacteraceae bacterium]
MPPADPGAHVDLHLPNGMMRQYSLTTPDRAPKSYILGIKRDANSRGGSKYIFDTLKVGHTLRISSPRNNFALVENADHVVLIAGGIGITPIWAMTQRLTELGRPFELHYASRSRADMIFLDKLKDMGSARPHFDDESADKFLDIKPLVASAAKGAHFYCCGPIPMLNAFEEATANLPAEQVHVEYFTPKEEKSTAGGFIVQLARSNKEFVIPPGKGILEVLRDAGLDVPYSCEQGICGACETAVVSGIPDHRDSVLTEKECAANKTMMICCSGSKGDKLVLDL